MPPLLNKKQTAKHLGIGLTTLYRWMKSGVFRVPMIVGTGRYDQTDVDAWVESRKRGGQ